MADILIAEDDADVRKWLAIALETEGHAVRLAADGVCALAAVRELVKEAGGTEAAACAFLAEGDAADRKDIIFLEKLPLFFK